MRFTTKMPAPTNPVAASSTVTFKLPIGRSYRRLWLRASGAGLSFGLDCIDEIRVMVNSKVIQRFPASHRNMLNLFQGRQSAVIDDDTFNLCIPFSRYNLSTLEAEDYTAINTGVADPQTGRAINQFQIEIDIAATGFTGTPKLEMWADQMENPLIQSGPLVGQPIGPGALPYLQQSTRDYQAADTYQISDLPRGGVSTQFIDSLALIPSTGTLDNFIIEANNVKLFERTAALNEHLQRDGVRVPQAGLYVIDRTEEEVGGDPFDVRNLSDWRLYIDTSAQMSLTLYTQYIGGLAD